ncbi:hypothetical protein [uncultured Mobiluncus sp.]|uniref:hypothetical protein n=1 Tax=uncultured Mobiluncus sp. TaxID=293425 RepID=UPI0026208D15|nr:hypothetical protein [uncultured Mobiluncus sp.]
MNLNALVISEMEAYLTKTGQSQVRFAREHCIRQSWLNRRMRGHTPWKLEDIDRLREAGVPINLGGVSC